jgi:D-alanyl-D-alanine-carboxypeptidase/D-alanyl-D-alanine-endopeptidase
MANNFQPADLANPYADYTVQQMYDFLNGYQLTRDPGQEFEYSNLGVGLLGHILVRIVGQSYETMERERVWQPLGMTHTAITFTPWMKEHLALGHSEDGAVTPNWDIRTLAGAGAIRSTAIDMLKFASANLHPERGPLEKAMAFAHQRRAAAGAMGIGLNWLTLPTSGDTIVWHNGGTGGYRTYIGLDLSAGTAVVVLTNSGGAGSDDIGLHLLNPATPLVPAPTPPKARTAIELPASTLSRYVGVYQLAPTFALTVSLNGGALTVQATGQGALRLWPETTTDFFLKEVDAQLAFVVDAQGETTALILHQNGVDQRARKVK